MLDRTYVTQRNGSAQNILYVYFVQCRNHALCIEQNMFYARRDTCCIDCTKNVSCATRDIPVQQANSCILAVSIQESELKQNSWKCCRRYQTHIHFEAGFVTPRSSKTRIWMYILFTSDATSWTETPLILLVRSNILGNVESYLFVRIGTSQ